MLWLMMIPLLIFGLAVGIVPVAIGILHDHRARLNGDTYSHLFFQPRVRRPPTAEPETAPEDLR
jgi:hypothetical protein